MKQEHEFLDLEKLLDTLVEMITEVNHEPLLLVTAC